jgi:hypothetical protein
MPPALDLQDGYSVRVTALDPVTSAVVAGVKIGTVVLTADSVGVIPAGPTESPAEWFLVPGPGA